MFNTSVIEVVIGLVFVFSLMAILVTQINTLIVNLLNLRARQLKQGLQSLITDRDMQARLIGHPLINLVKTTVRPEEKLSAQEAAKVSNAAETRVAYIAPSTFVDSLTDILMVEADKLYTPLSKVADDIPDSDEKSRVRQLLRTLRSGFTEQTLRDLREAFSVVSDSKSRARLMAGLEELEEALNQLTFRSDELVPLLQGIRNIADEGFRKAMETLIASARTLEEAEQKLQNWFNDGMSRVSEVYKLRMQIISIGVAFMLTMVFNVDAIYLARTLWEDPELRQSVVAAAENYQQTGAVVQVADLESDATVPEPDALTPIGAQTAEATPDASLGPVPEATAEPDDLLVMPEDNPDLVTAETLARNVDDVTTTVQQLRGLQLPIGWEFTPIDENLVEASKILGLSDPTNNPRNLYNFVPGNSDGWLGLVIVKILGIIGTTMAAAQGAPFWFDLLNKIARR
jgi:hypothetical protein